VLPEVGVSIRIEESVKRGVTVSFENGVSRSVLNRAGRGGGGCHAVRFEQSAKRGVTISIEQSSKWGVMVRTERGVTWELKRTPKGVSQTGLNRARKEGVLWSGFN